MPLRLADDLTNGPGGPGWEWSDMTDVVFGFDVEDPVNESADDALLALCRIFSEEEVPCSLFVAGEKARVLRQRGRHDVIAAMRDHEIAYHGNYWAEFPKPALEYGQDMSWDDAVAFALSVEAPGLHDVADITGQFPVTWCCHQAQQCPQLSYALKLAGVRCWAGGPRGWIMDWLSWGRSNCTLGMQGAWAQSLDPTRRNHVKPPADPVADLDGLQGEFERMAETNDFLTLVGHPTCWATADWGGLYEFCMLFRRGGPGPYPRPANISKSQPRSPEDQKAALEFVRQILRWVKTRGDVNVTTYSALCDRDEENPVQWVAMDDALSLARRMSEELTYITDFGTSFSPADVVGLMTFACDYCFRQGEWPAMLPIQRLVGPTERPLKNEGRVTLTRENLFAGSLAAYSIMMDERRIPGTLRASRVDVGPGTWLRVLTEFVGQSVETGNMPGEVTVEAGPDLPEAVSEPVIQDRRFGSTNHRPGLEYDRLWDLLKWQAWSYRPAVSR